MKLNKKTMKIDPQLSRYLHVLKGDITLQTTDAIVNAANPSLLGGGGVDGAIHRAAGPELLEECRTLGGCEHGEARITKGYLLKALYVIHTPGPVFKNGKQGEREILANSYYNTLLIAKKYSLHSISFPAISSGIYGYPKDEACEVAVSTVLNFITKEHYYIDVYFVLYDDINYNIYINYINKLIQ